MTKHLEYLRRLQNITELIIATQSAPMEACAEAFANALINGNEIFLFGTGHSHMLAEELFYRAGGLVRIRPMLETSLMLHESASKSTEMERLSGYARIMLDRYNVHKNDVLVIISNSGRNTVCLEMAIHANARGVKVVALTSLAHSRASESRHPCGKRLFELADIVLDNCGCEGDACVYFDALGRNAAPTSTSAGAAILNAVVAGSIELMIQKGFVPEVFASSNIDGGDRINESYVKKYRNDIVSL